MSIVQDERKLIVTVDDGAGDEVQFTRERDGGLYIEIEEPWAGNTESGFGARTSITLKPDEAETLFKWLLDNRSPA